MIRVAVIGCGAVAARYYGPALAALERAGLVEVSAVVDPVVNRATALSRLFRSSSSLIEISQIDHHNVDLALVTSPNIFHSPQSTELLSQGIAVLVEKPMACTVADAERMLRAAEGAKQVLAVGLLRRFFLSCQSIKRFISLKLLGQPQSFCFSEGARFNWPVESAALFDKETAGGGILIDIGSHALDLMQWWFGTPARLRYRDDAMGGVEATCLVHIEYDSGLHGKILLSRDYQLTNTYSLEFEKGVITWRVGDVNHIQVDVRATDVRLKCEVQQLSQSEGTDYETRSFPQSVTAQLTNVIESIQQTQQLVVPASEGLKSLQLIEKCYANRELLDMPWLTTEELTIGRQCAASSLC